MEKMTGEAGTVNQLEASTAEKSILHLMKTFFSTYKIPLLFLVLFGSVSMRALYSDKFSFGLKRQKTYRFKNESLGFFIGDVNFLNTKSSDEVEQKMVELFPERIQPKVIKVIRPVLVLCEKHELDPFWVLSVLWTESHFRQEVISKKGARGLMQLMPQTYMETLSYMKANGIQLESDRGEEYLRQQYESVYEELGYTKLVSKLRNLEVGIFYLKNLLEAFNENHIHATMAYNMGPFWLKNQLKNNLPAGKKNNYLSKVLKNYLHITKTLSQNSNVAFIPRI
jgi:soluble lytic murein transglycosylase